MSAATSQIAFKGFMLGYLHKTAEDTIMADARKVLMNNQIKGDMYVPSPKLNTEHPYVDQGPADPTPYGDLGSQLAGLWPGAAAGAAVTGAGSVGIDALRGKPVNVKRAILLSLLMGVPLGMAGQMGIQGGTDSFKNLGGNVAAAGKKSLVDILRGAGSVSQTAQNLYGQGKETTGDMLTDADQLLDKGVTAGKNIVDKGVNAGKNIVDKGKNIVDKGVEAGKDAYGKSKKAVQDASAKAGRKIKAGVNAK